MTKEERAELGLKGTQHVENNYNFNKHTQKWRALLKDVHDRYGSWKI